MMSWLRHLIRPKQRLAQGKLRLLLVDSYDGVGGGQKQLVDFAVSSEAMNEASVLAVVDSSNWRFRKLLENSGIRYRCLDFSVARKNGRARVSLVNALRIVRQAIAVRKIVAEYKADIVQFYNYQSGAMCIILALLRTNAILTILHLSSRTQTPGGLLDYVKFFTADAVCYNSYATRNSYSKVAKVFGIPENILYSVVTPPLTSVEGRPEDQDIFCANMKRKYIGYFGSLFPWKNVDQVISSVNLLNYSLSAGEEYFALIVGASADGKEGKYQAYIKDLAKELLPQRSAILTTRDNIFPIMGRCDVLVLPSEGEPYGRVLIEAMYLRVPFVAIDSGGPREIWRAGGRKVGALVPAKDLHALAAAIREQSMADRRTHPGVPWKLSVEGIVTSHFRFFHDQFA